MLEALFLSGELGQTQRPPTRRPRTSAKNAPMSQIESIGTARALRGRASLEEARKALNDPALRRIGLGTEFNGFDTKRKNETAADARVKLHAAWGASLAGRLFVLNSADVDVRSILDDPTERGLRPPFDITPIFVTGYDGGTCP